MNIFVKRGDIYGIISGKGPNSYIIKFLVHTIEM